MESLRDIRQNIKAVKSTQQIMQTMQMISSARIRKAQEAMESARPFAKKMLEMVDDLRQDILDMSEDGDSKESWASRIFVNKTGAADKLGLVIITGDKGLAGSFNAVILRKVIEFMKEHRGKEIYVFAVGKKGRDFCARLSHEKVKIAYESIGIFPKVTYAHAELLGEAVLKKYFELNLGSVTLIYNDFKSMGSQHLVQERLLPFDFDQIQQEREERDFVYEPGIKEIFTLLVPRLFKANMYRFLLESQAANLAATMNAMDAASKNAGELVGTLSVKLNKVRQAGITNEILDIVNGAEALNS